MRSNHAERWTSRENTDMEHNTQIFIQDSMDQGQAAALAVLAANVRKCQQDLLDSRVDQVPMTEREMAVITFWKMLEDIGVQSIAHNDGNVVEHIGTAARQMNPLLS